MTKKNNIPVARFIQNFEKVLKGLLRQRKFSLETSRQKRNQETEKVDEDDELVEEYWKKRSHIKDLKRILISKLRR